MNVEELQKWFNCLCITGGHADRRGDHIPLALECNHCSQDDYLFVEHLAANDFHGAAAQVFAHVMKYHPEQVTPPIEPVTQEEIDEVFGLSRTE